MEKRRTTDRLRHKLAIDAELDEELEQSFPASDPPKLTRSDPETQITPNRQIER